MIDWKSLEEKPYEPLVPLIRKMAAEGSVLLKNEGQILPLKKEDRISLFGRTQIDYLKSGLGSGGLVRVEYVVNILDGILSNNDITLNKELADVYSRWCMENPVPEITSWEKAPWYQPEMPLDDKIVSEARNKSDVAVIVIGRFAGEARDNSAEKGSWYLSDEEESMLEIVTKYFDKTVVLLNVGNIMDMTWVEKYNIKSVMYIWQGGQEGGNAVADVLSGKVSPSGKLTDTIAKDIFLYPSTRNFGSDTQNIYEEDIYVGYRYFETFKKDDVLYPFGFGLSYTEFEQNVKSVKEAGGKIQLEVEVKNIGEYSGRDVVQVYFEAPQGKLGKSARELCAFAKTRTLKPEESEILNIEFLIDSMCAYDDGGVTGNKSCYVMEAGEYKIYCGACVRCAKSVYTYNLNELKVTKQCTEALSPVIDFKIKYPVCENGEYSIGYKPVPKRTVDYSNRIKQEMPKALEYTGDKGIKLIDVRNGKNTIEEFVAQLGDKELKQLVHGEGMCSPKVRPGNAGAIGGLTEDLAKFGIPAIAVHDGPSGIRMDSEEKATSLPNGTAIASSWDVAFAEEIYENLSIELCTHKIDSILGPGINIHRSPLNGRNFEYFSEDPYLTGKMAAAHSLGMNKYGNSATIKHFMANSQEYERRKVDSVASERAFREIYLKGFEMAVREGGVTSIMSSYNPINGNWAANNYELNTVILRDEWDYKGFVMTDWWPMLSENSNPGNPAEKINLKNLVEAQNDIYMLTANINTCIDNLSESLENGEITRAQLQRNAINILRYIAKSHAMIRYMEEGESFKETLENKLDTLCVVSEFTQISSGKEMLLDMDNAGKYLIAVEYTSEEDPLLQMTVNVLLNNVNAACVTVNATEGKNVTVYREISIADKKAQVKLNYPDDAMTVNKVTFMK